MTFPTAAAMITRRKSLGTSTGPAAIAIAIYFLPIAWLYRFAARGCTGPPRSECVLTRRNCSRTEVDRIATARLSTPPSACRLGNDDKRYHCGGRDLIRLSARHGVFACDRMRAAASARAAPHACWTISSTGERAARRLGPLE